MSFREGSCEVKFQGFTLVLLAIFFGFNLHFMICWWCVGCNDFLQIFRRIDFREEIGTKFKTGPEAWKNCIYSVVFVPTQTMRVELQDELFPKRSKV